MALNFLNDGYFAGKVGIGAPAASKKLEVTGNAQVEGTLTVKTASNNIRLLDINDSTVNFSVGVNGKFQIRDVSAVTNPFQIEKGAASNSLYIDSSGKVGIGTDDPIELLHLYGGVGNPTRIRLQADDGQDDVLTFHQSTTQKGAVGYDDSDDVVSLTYGGLSGTTGIKINSSGNVGIGTTSPGGKLDISYSGTGGTGTQGIGEGLNISSFTPNITFNDNSTGVDNYAIHLNQNVFTLGRYTSSTSQSPDLVLVSGNVGIGTTSPTAGLHVVGTGLFTGLVSGITPVNAANFVTKAYVDGSSGGTGPFLPLAGGTMSGAINMGDNDITGIDELKFSSGTKLGDGGGSDWVDLTYSNSGDGGLRVRDINGQVQGYLYGTGGVTSEFGVLDGSGSWALRCVEDGLAELRYDNAIKLQTGATGVGTATTAGGTLVDGWITTTQLNTVNNDTIATTAYVNNKIQLIPAGLAFEGTWDARTVAEGGAGTPPSASPLNGQFWIVSIDGSQNLSGITDWKVGDWAIYVDNGAGTDGWQKVDNSSVLDGSGTGGTMTAWAGSGTSNTLTDSPVTFTSAKVEIPRNVEIFTSGYPYIDLGVSSSNYFRIIHDNPNDILKIGKNGAATASSVIINPSGNVGIGAVPVGNPGTKFLAVGTAGSVAGGIQLWASSSQTHYLQFGDANSGGEVYRGGIGYNHASETLLFLQASSTALSFTGSQAATFTGNLNVNGNATLGDATTDDHVFNGQVTQITADALGYKLYRTGGGTSMLISAAGDAEIEFGTDNGSGTNTTHWTIGKDNTDNSFRISNSASLGTSDTLTLVGANATFAGSITFNGTLNSTGNLILSTASAGANIEMYTNGNMYYDAVSHNFRDSDASPTYFNITASQVNSFVSLAMNNYKITTLATPTNAADAATKAYVDAHGGGLGPFLPLSAGSSYPLTGDLYLKTTNDASIAREQIIWQTSQGTNRSFIRVGGSYASNALEFGTGNSTLGMILHANAGLSIGTTVATTLPPASGLLVQGNVGIGTTLPIGKFNVSKDSTTDGLSQAITVSSSSVSTKRMNLGYVPGSNYAFIDVINYAISNTNQALSLQPNGGNVGIGVTDPDAKLEIKASGSTTGLTFKTTDAAGNENFFIQDGGRTGVRYYPLTVGQASGTSAATGARFQVSTTANDFVVLNDSSTGIGTITPQSKLQVAGGIQMADDTDTASAAKVGTMRYRTGTEYVEVTGTELITNGDFASDTSWSKQTGWTVSGGTGNCDGTSTNALLFQNNIFITGKIYNINFEITSYTSGVLRLRDNGVLLPTNYTAIGSYTLILTATQTGFLGFQNYSSFIGSIDNVSVIEVTAEDASYADMCMQTGSSTYEWVNIVRNTY